VHPHHKPLLVFDGDCGFCRAWIARWQRTTGDRVDYAPYQEVASRFPEIPESRFAGAVQLVEPGGRWSQGAEAVFRSLAYAPGRGWPLWLYRHLPGFAPASERLYRLVAGNRRVAARVTTWVWGAHVVPPGDTLTTWLFLRALAVVYGVAFASLWTQILGLAGSRGILPAAQFLDGVRQRYGPERLWLVPSFCWVSGSDGFLVGLCAAGMVLSLLLSLVPLVNAFRRPTPWLGPVISV
jgi:predicted DCC family thiol-disulfide oxidoreductase YuxK